MDQLSPEIQVSIFQRLDSNEMVKLQRICKKFQQVIDERTFLWRRLVLPERRIGWKPSILTLFDRKSQSTLEEVTMRVSLGEREVDGFKKVLERSRNTLRRVFIPQAGCSNKVQLSLSELSWKFPKMIDCAVGLTEMGSIRLFGNVKTEGQAEDKRSTLKVLWIFPPISKFQNNFGFLDNLTSFWTDWLIQSADWRRILQNPSRSLKHLRIPIKSSNRDYQIHPLGFPLLQVLEIGSGFGDDVPIWMKIPLSSTLILNHQNYILFSLVPIPRISSLWIHSFNEIFALSSKIPTLQELRINMSSVMMNCQELIAMLRQRAVNKGAIVDGIRMSQIKTLVLPLNGISNFNLLELKRLVERVIDLNLVSRFVEVEVE